MNILGLHFGHDATVAVIRDGRIVNSIVRERLSRHKHALALDAATVETALRDAGIAADDVDLCAVTSTQSMEMVSLDPRTLAVTADPHPDHSAPTPLHDAIRNSGKDVAAILQRGFLDGVYRPPPGPDDRDRHLRHRAAAYFPEQATRDRASLAALGAFDTMLAPKEWSQAASLADLAARDVRPMLERPEWGLGMHLPVTVDLLGRKVAGYLIHHHLAHAAGAFYPTGRERAAILSHDGWPGLHPTNPGLFWAEIGNRLVPLAPHYLAAGGLYELAGFLLGLGHAGQEGKLMGLAPYGKPAFVDDRFVGNMADIKAAGIKDYFYGWFEYCRDAAAARGDDMSALADPARLTAPVNADIAASTQAVFEATMLRAARSLRAMTDRAGLALNSLCLVGGAALNCPANSLLWRQSGFDTVDVPAWCDNSGLALGAGLALYHAILDRPRDRDAVSASPYLGAAPDAADGAAAIAAAGTRLAVETPADAAAAAGAEIAAGKVVAWFEGRSEIGPRALGHRSLLADPRDAENWARVNRIKRREGWRPFAPAVLAEYADDWFDGCPLPAPHMLFTARVANEALPAITHVDGSARIQTVASDAGAFRRVVEAFHRATGVPVVLNTSFNGPGEPIVERPAEAVAFLLDSEVDALYMFGNRISRSR